MKLAFNFSWSDVCEGLKAICSFYKSVQVTVLVNPCHLYLYGFLEILDQRVEFEVVLPFPKVSNWEIVLKFSSSDGWIFSILIISWLNEDTIHLFEERRDNISQSWMD